MAGNITPYEINAGVEQPLRPDEHGPQELAENARRVTTYGEQEKQNIDKTGEELQSAYDAHATMHGTAAMAQMEEAHQKAWQNFMNGPDAADPQKMAAFRASLDQQENDTLSSITGGGLASDRVTERFSTEMSNYKMRREQKETTDIAAYQGIQAMQALETTKKSANNMAEGDVDGIPNGMALYQHNEDALNANLQIGFKEKAVIKEQIEKDRTDLVFNNAQGRTNRNPTQALEDLKTGDLSVSGEWGKYLSSEKRHELIDQAQAAIGHVEHANLAADELATKVAQRDFNTKANDAFADNVHWQTDGTVIVDPHAWQRVNELSQTAKASNGRIRPEQMESLQNWLARTQKEQREGINPTTNMQTFATLWPKIEAGTATQGEILDAHMSREDTKKAIEKLNDPARKDPMWTTVYKRVSQTGEAGKQLILGGGLTIATPQHYQRVTEFQNHLDDLVDDMRQSGAKPQQIREKLFTPSSPDYVLRPENMAPYQINNKQGLANMSRNLKTGVAVPAGPPVAPRKAGETYEDYRKRNGSP